MIADFSFWRDELQVLKRELNYARDEYLMAAPDTTRVPAGVPLRVWDRANFRIERALFYSALTMRKMHEAAKSDFSTQDLNVDWSARRALNGEPLNTERNFIMRSSGSEIKSGSKIKSWRYICDRVIHSRVLTFGGCKDLHIRNFEGFWVGSDKDKQNEREYFVYWRDYFELISCCVSIPNKEVS